MSNLQRWAQEALNASERLIVTANKSVLMSVKAFKIDDQKQWAEPVYATAQEMLSNARISLLMADGAMTSAYTSLIMTRHQIRECNNTINRAHALIRQWKNLPPQPEPLPQIFKSLSSEEMIRWKHQQSLLHQQFTSTPVRIYSGLLYRSPNSFFSN
jgi:hypothetical protein